MLLPALKFFEPKPAFFREMKTLVGTKTVVDCGAGVGHVSKSLQDRGHKTLAIDLHSRETSAHPIVWADATHFPFDSSMVALIARPCGGDWIRSTIDRAIRSDAIVVYIGVERNFARDLEDLPYGVVLISKNVGKAKEQMFSILPQTQERAVSAKRKTKTKIRQIKTAILVDFMGSSMATPEEEIATHKEKYGALLAPAILNVHEPRYAWDGDYGIKEGTELVIYDFGGLMPGSSLMEDNAREIVKWANDHPNSLVIIVSSFTYGHFIERETKELGLDLFNIVLDDFRQDDPIPGWFRAGL